MTFPRLATILTITILLVSACSSTPENTTANATQPTQPAQPTPIPPAPATEPGKTGLAPAPSSAPAPAAAAPSRTTPPSAPAPSMAAPPAKAAAPVPDRPAAPPPPQVATLPAGTELTVVLIDSLNSGKNQAGDEFMGSLGAPVVVDGKTVLKSGTKVRGRVTDAEGAGRVKGKASMSLVLTGIVDGAKTIPIVTRTFVADPESSMKRDAVIGGVGAGAGAAVGAAAGGKKGAGLGAIIGGAGAVLATRGKEVEFDSEAKLRFVLDRAVEVPLG